jgi:hypothetical protein
VTTTPLTGPEEQHRPVTALHQNSSGQGEDLSPRSPRHARGVPARKESTAIGSGSADTVVLRFNEDNMANEELYERAGHASDVARSARLNAERHRVLAKKARDAWRTVQLEHPERQAWLPLTYLIASGLLGLDSWAAYFAAEALGGDQRVTLLWAAVFLVILGLLEAGLAWFAERSRTIFRLVALGLTAFAVLLALLRFGFFTGVGAGPIAAIAGAVVFTACTILFVVGGFAAVRYAETLDSWRARRHARKAESKAATAEVMAARRAAERDRRIDAYVGRIRPTLLRENCNAQATEAKVRAHLLGEPR